jgi:F-box interacting protein
MLESLPAEIVTQILLLLPIKSILTCICVCKPWKTLIQNPTFVSSHLHHSITNNNNNNNHFLLFKPCSLNPEDEIKELYALHDNKNDNFTQHTTFDFPLHVPGLNGIYTCNGLVCLTDHIYNFVLWNPSVRKCMQLPSPPNVTYKSHASIGFGFDAKNNDFKVVRIVINQNRHNLQKDRPVVEVYSLSTGEWRMITDPSPPICTLSRRAPNAFVNGALHWIAMKWAKDRKVHCFILVFDLGDEVFREIMLPKIQLYDPSYSVNVYGNSIAFFQDRASYYVYGNFAFLQGRATDIWLMKEYGVTSSWTMVLTVAHGKELTPIRPIGFRRNGEVILIMHYGRLVSQDLETREKKDLRITAMKYAFVDSYVESLVLLDKAANDAVAYGGKQVKCIYTWH